MGGSREGTFPSPLKPLFILLFVLPLCSGAQHFQGKVISVRDGNTLEVVAAGELFRVVLLGIDCPELGQAHGHEAKMFLEKSLSDQEVHVHIYGKDRLRNYIGIVLKDSVDIRLTLLENGLAWTAERDPIAQLEEVRVESERKRRGLWMEPSPVAPWVYRRQQSMQQPKGR